MITFHIITLFPKPIESYLGESILKKAQESQVFTARLYNPIDFTEASATGALPRRVDDKPYGGGPGMVMRAEPIMKAIQSAVGRKKNVGYIHFAPRAEPFTTAIAQTIAQESLQKKSPLKDIVIICGRYEGIDSRICELYPGRILSVGDYVLTGGEIPAMIVIDAVARQLPGVLGCADSREETRDASGKYYTRPEKIIYKKKRYDVPAVLLSGNHKEIEQWRRDNK